MVEHDEEEELLVQTNREEQLLHQDDHSNFNIRDALNTPPPDYESSDYTPRIQNGALHENGAMGQPTVVCRVCQQLVFIRGREGQRVVKCSNCHEATPIKAPPAGKKYIRCPCNALLTCRSTSARISCPRANCKRIINVGSAPLPTTSDQSILLNNGDSRVRVSCGHCNELFKFRNATGLAKCPYCRKTSSVGSAFVKHKAIISAIVGIIFLAAGIGVTVGTFQLAINSKGIYVSWAGAYLLGIFLIIRSIYYCCMTVSNVQPTA